GPEGIFLSCLGGGNGVDGPGGIALLDHSSFDVLGPWENDRGPQYLSYDAWWHLNQNTLVTSEWGTPSMIEDGVNPELLLANKYARALLFGTLPAGKHAKTVARGAPPQWVPGLRPPHAPGPFGGFVGVSFPPEVLPPPVWRRPGGGEGGPPKKLTTFPAEPADP